MDHGNGSPGAQQLMHPQAGHGDASANCSPRAIRLRTQPRLSAAGSGGDSVTLRAPRHSALLLATP